MVRRTCRANSISVHEWFQLEEWERGLLLEDYLALVENMNED